ncbi:hypothetical protein CcaCcLH18_04804 [Colletotrichum camelliae]|nr:hypothetical protein CcaCcLH18_04804 [Colletotrichum camelliae]
MVSLAEVRTSNSALTSSTVPKTALFVGATSGIGKYTLAELVSLKLPVKCYIVGRKASEPALHPLLEALRRTNPQAELIWVEAEVSLLSEVKRVCELVKENEDRVDLLCLTAGYAPFGGRNDTPEGIEVTHALQYYGRMLFTLALLPLLRAAPSPRVLTVLGGSFLSTNLLVDDLDLRKAGNFGGMRSQTHMSIMNTLFLDRLASDPENSKVAFVHNWPGAVDTGNMGRYHTPSWLSPAPVTVLLKPVFWVLISFMATAWLVAFLVLFRYCLTFDPNLDPFNPSGQGNGWKPNTIDVKFTGMLKGLRRRLKNHSVLATRDAQQTGKATTDNLQDEDDVNWFFACMPCYQTSTAREFRAKLHCTACMYMGTQDKD